MNIIKSTEYFELSIDDLLKTERNYTKEERLLFDSGEEVVFFDNIEEMEAEKEQFNNYIKSKRYEIKDIVKTINERIAVILI